MAEHRAKRVNERVNGWLDFPIEFSLDLPKVILLGNRQLSIENHHGISFYGTDKIQIACSGGAIVIEGEDLVLKTIAQDELCIDGRIGAVRYLGTELS